MNASPSTPAGAALPPRTSVFLVGSVASLAGILFGFDSGIAASSGGAVNQHFGITDDPFLKGLWVACVPLGALFGALLGSKVSTGLGRKKGLLLNAVLFFLAISLAAFAPTLSLFVISRFLMGLAIGNSAVITPMYLAEMVPPAARGRVGFLYQLSIVVGILVSFVIGVVVTGLVADDNENWRIMIGFALIPAVIFFFGMLRMPESARWLVEKGREEDARRSLLRTVDEEEAEKVLGEIVEANARSEKAPLSAIFGRMIFPVIILGFLLQFFQQSTGINADMYFGPEIFKEGGFGSAAALWAQVGMGVVNLAATIFSIFLVDRIGRRRLMIIGATGIVAMLAVQSYLFHLYDSDRAAAGMGPSVTSQEHKHTLPNVGSTVGHPSHKPSSPLPAETAEAEATFESPVTGWIYASILVYIVFFAISAGPLCWLIISEIFPLRFRGIGMSIAVAANWLVNYLVSQLFPVMKTDLGMPVTTLIYAAFTLVGLILAIRYLPETKGVPLERIEANIWAGRPLRRIGDPEEGTERAT